MQIAFSYKARGRHRSACHIDFEPFDGGIVEPNGSNVFPAVVIRDATSGSVVAVLASVAAAGAPLRLAFASEQGDPIESGVVQARFWERDQYRLQGAIPNTTFTVRVLWWLDNPTCSGGPPTQGQDTTTLTTNDRGKASARAIYDTPVPDALIGHLSGFRWFFLYGSSGKVAYTTACTPIDLR